ncbi:Transcription factor TFIIIB component B'' homolog [Strongyloides ratti]|uniref:Transcription factor TFIIIB component B'' homolog n=1 Tax=Strongyloides ratti TaxID=34506 RepID=A0A090LCW6_STRRB|nr:Transcription factor TFIIIB component B'' homolog [Strongyloides ratti]CEF65345.1 Transcription factor TFIIIB component B'' homolog [Strongyloides ratti]
MKRRAKITIKPNLNISSIPSKIIEKESEEIIEVEVKEKIDEPINIEEPKIVDISTVPATICTGVTNVSVKDFNLEPYSRALSVSPSIAPSITPSIGSRKKKKLFTGKEELDPTKFTMMDLIYWNPKHEKGLDKEKFKLPKSSTLAPRPKMVKVEDDNVGPRVKVDEDGNLVIDQESLIVKQQAENNIWETVDESTLPRKITSLSFRKNKVIRKSHAWSQEETDLFYQIIQATGPDFTLMHQFFPTKARAELKAKYNREEKYNSAKLTQALNSPAMMDDIFLEKCLKTAEELERIKKEVQEERERKAKELAEAKEARKEAKLAKLKELENDIVENDVPIRKITKSNSVYLRKRKIIEDSDTSFDSPS